MSEDELDMYKKLISFFDLLGITKDDLMKLKYIVKEYDKVVDVIKLMQEDIKTLDKRTKVDKKDGIATIIDSMNKNPERIKF